MKKYLLAVTAIIAIACAQEKKLESPESLVYTQWFRFVEVENDDNSRVSDETQLLFHLTEFRITNRHIISSPTGQQEITYDTLIGKRYKYTRPTGTMTFEREIYNPCTLLAGPNTLQVQFVNDTLDFVKN